MKRLAFILVEVLCVIGIISILLMILFPVFRQAMAKGKETVCISNLRQIVAAANLYQEDWGAIHGWGIDSSPEFRKQYLANTHLECPMADVAWRASASYVMLPLPPDGNATPSETLEERRKRVQDVLSCMETRGSTIPVVLDQNHAGAREAYRGSGTRFWLIGRLGGSVDRVSKARVDELVSGRANDVPCDRGLFEYNL